MKVIILISTLVLAGCCRAPSGSLAPGSGFQQETVLSSEPNKWTTVHVVAMVERVMTFRQAGNHETFSVEDGEPRFVLFLDVVSAEPPTYWFTAGRKADFAIHDAARWFGTDREQDIRERSYLFTLVIAERLLEGMKRRSTVTSVRPTDTEP